MATIGDSKGEFFVTFRSAVKISLLSFQTIFPVAALRSKMFLDNRFYLGPPGRVFGQEFLSTGKSQAN